MADDKPLETRIKDAQRILNSSFGIKKKQEGQESNRFLNIKDLADAYKEEASTSEVSRQLLLMAKSIRAMRSSYLPVDFFLGNPDALNQIDLGSVSVDVSSDIGKVESYENTFMRMLGMPAVSNPERGVTSEDAQISFSDNLKVINPISGLIEEIPFEEVNKTILFERQQPRTSRRFLIDNTIYNVFKESLPDINGDTISIRSLTVSEKAELLQLSINNGKLTNPLTGEVVDSVPNLISRNSESGNFENPIFGLDIPTSLIDKFASSARAEDVRASIANLSKDLWKFSYLLLPPIQNREIARCINEPDKIAALPFSNIRSRNINNNKIRPTLLESIIRIRLDKISGAGDFTTPPEEGGEFANVDIGNPEDDNPEPVAEQYGILEALFILRLRSVITGLAQKMITDVDVIINEMDKSGQMPAAENTESGQSVVNPSNEAAVPFTDLPSALAFAINALNENTRSNLNQQKLVEDSIMFLLGDSSEALDLQAQTQRSSSIHDSHMMSGLIDLVDVPRKRINEQLIDVSKSRKKTASGPIGGKIQEIGAALGTDIGIGTLDLAVFSLALFTISERSLLGLLSTAQFERIKNGEFSALIPVNEEKVLTAKAINELTQLVYDGYRVFIADLDSD